VLLFHVLCGGYCAVSAVFLLITVLEGWAFHGGWTLARMMGLVLCLAWPLLVIAFLLHNHVSCRFAGAVRLASL
jgi:hypothetical protein